MSNKKRVKKSGIMLIAGGLTLLGAALLLVCYNLYDEKRAGNYAFTMLEQLQEQIPDNHLQAYDLEPDGILKEAEVPDYILNPNMEMPALEADGHEYIGILDIPSLQISLPVMNEWSDSNLRLAPCRYSGTIYRQNMVIAGHNYSSHFGALENISPGALVNFTDAEGNCFSYEAAAVEVLAPDAVSEMVEGEWDLTLFTCTFGGRSRVTVRCEQINP